MMYDEYMILSDIRQKPTEETMKKICLPIILKKIKKNILFYEKREVEILENDLHLQFKYESKVKHNGIIMPNSAGIFVMYETIKAE